MNIFNFAIDFVSITNAKSSKELEKYIALARESYPRDNEDNACIIALCINANLSIDQMILLGKKYGKYIKQNPCYDICMLNAIDMDKIKDIEDIDCLSYKSIIDHNSKNKPYISYGDFIDYKIIEESEDVNFIKSIFYFEEVTRDTDWRLKYVAAKNLKKINTYFFDFIKFEFINAFINLYISGFESIYDNEQYPNLIIQEEDYSLMHGDLILEQFKNKVKDCPISCIGKFANRALELIKKCPDKDNFYSARDIVMVALSLDSGYCLNNTNKNLFDGRLEKVINNFNSI